MRRQNTHFMEVNMKHLIKIIATITIVSILFCLCGCTTEETTTKQSYSLDEINDGVYAIYYVTHSRAPAYNYDVVTLNCNGSIRTFKGNVNITYTSTEPHVDIVESNYINRDKVYVYIPKGSVEHAKDVGIG